MTIQVVEEEVPAILDGCEQFRSGYRPNLVFVVATKRHHKRFFRVTANGQLENTLPGTVVDEKVVRVDLREFYMQAHKPLKVLARRTALMTLRLQGTAKMIQCSMLVNEVNASQEHIEDLMHGLCYNHQIISRAVSIPGNHRRSSVHELTRFYSRAGVPGGRTRQARPQLPARDEVSRMRHMPKTSCIQDQLSGHHSA